MPFLWTPVTRLASYSGEGNHTDQHRSIQERLWARSDFFISHLKFSHLLITFVLRSACVKWTVVYANRWFYVYVLVFKTKITLKMWFWGVVSGYVGQSTTLTCFSITYSRSNRFIVCPVVFNYDTVQHSLHLHILQIMLFTLTNCFINGDEWNNVRYFQETMQVILLGVSKVYYRFLTCFDEQIFAQNYQKC